MNPTLRNILATLAGLAAASVTVASVEAIDARLFPLHAGLDAGADEPPRRAGRAQ